MIYGYARVSTRGQMKDVNCLEAQEKLLKENGAVQLFIDSFTSIKSNWPQLDLLLAKLLELSQKVRKLMDFPVQKMTDIMTIRNREQGKCH